MNRPEGQYIALKGRVSLGERCCRERTINICMGRWSLFTIHTTAMVGVALESMTMSRKID